MTSSTFTLKLRPSDAHTWLTCRGSCGLVARLRAEGKIFDSPEDYTNEGAQAHKLAEFLLNAHFSHTLLSEEAKADIAASYSEEMRTVVGGYVAFVAKVLRSATRTWVEEKVDVYYSDRTGYVDAAGQTLKKFHIIDLKYGRGVSVQAVRNPQLATYARSLINKHFADHPLTPNAKISLTIWQPRVLGEAPERTWDLTMCELDEFCAEISTTAESIQADPFGQPFCPGEDQCRFCPAAPLCPHRASLLLGGMEGDESIHALQAEDEADPAPPSAPLAKINPTLPEASSLTPEQLARILTLAPQIRSWLTGIEKHATDQILAGSPLPGFRVVATNPHRKWVDEEQARTFMRRKFAAHQIEETKLITPAKALELYEASGAWPKTVAELGKLIVRPEGNPTLVPADDKRPDYKAIDVHAEFADTQEGAELL